MIKNNHKFKINTTVFHIEIQEDYHIIEKVKIIEHKGTSYHKGNRYFVDNNNNMSLIVYEDTLFSSILDAHNFLDNKLNNDIIELQKYNKIIKNKIIKTFNYEYIRETRILKVLKILKKLK
jgi:hypothetical protein